jgi:hypothetical protein
LVDQYLAALKLLQAPGLPEIEGEATAVRPQLKSQLTGGSTLEYHTLAQAHGISPSGRIAPIPRIQCESDLEYQVEKELLPLRTELAGASMAAYDRLFGEQFAPVARLYTIFRVNGSISEKDLKAFVPKDVRGNQEQTAAYIVQTMRDVLDGIQNHLHRHGQREFIPADDKEWDSELESEAITRRIGDIYHLDLANFERT